MRPDFCFCIASISDLCASRTLLPNRGHILSFFWCYLVAYIRGESSRSFLDDSSEAEVRNINIFVLTWLIDYVIESLTSPYNRHSGHHGRAEAPDLTIPNLWGPRPNGLSAVSSFFGVGRDALYESTLIAFFSTTNQRTIKPIIPIDSAVSYAQPSEVWTMSDQ